MEFIDTENEPDKFRKTERNVPERINKMRSVAAQCFAALAINILTFSCGNFKGFTTTFLEQESNLTLSMEPIDRINFGFYYYMQPAGLLIGGIFGQMVGARQTMLMCSFVLTCNWVLFYWVSKVSMLLFIQAVVGLMMGMFQGPSYVYLAEISQPNTRSTLMATLSLSLVLGEIFTKNLALQMDVNDIPLTNFVIPCISCVMVYFLPESPYWLANSNSDKGVEDSLKWFRGWTTSKNIKLENLSIINGRNMVRETIKALLSKGFTGAYFISCLKFQVHKSILIPLKFIWHICLIAVYSGSYALVEYHAFFLSEIHSPLDQDMVLTSVQITQILSMILCICIVNRFGKRKLALISLIGTSISMTLASIISSILTKYQITDEFYHIFFLISLLLAIFMSHAGINNIILIMSAEVFPTKVRQIGVGIVLLEISLSGITFSVLFNWLIDTITVPGTCFMFAMIGISGFSILHRSFYETENKTLVEIEQHFFKVKKLKDDQTLPPPDVTQI